MIGLYLRSYRHVPEARPLIVRYAPGYSLAVAIWLLSLAFDPPERYVLWGAALAWEYSLPTLARRLHASIPVHTSHVPERFALFTLIVLGETLVAVALGTSGSDWQASAAAIATFGFLIAAAIWWVYFGSGGESAMIRTTKAILVFTHVHIPLLAALTAVSAGIALAIEEASSPHLDAGSRWALAGGAAVYLACVTIAQRATVQGLPSRTVPARAAAVVALGGLALVGGDLDPVLLTGLAAGTLVALVVFKLWNAHRTLTAPAS